MASKWLPPVPRNPDLLSGVLGTTNCAKMAHLRLRIGYGGSMEGLWRVLWRGKGGGREGEGRGKGGGRVRERWSCDTAEVPRQCAILAHNPLLVFTVNL